MKKQSQYDLIIVLLSIALILSLSGTIINLNRLHNTEYVFSGLTGAASFSYGFTNLTITSNTALSLFGGNADISIQPAMLLQWIQITLIFLIMQMGAISELMGVAG